MKIPVSDASAAERRLLQARKVAKLLDERQADVSSPFMAGLMRSMTRSLLAFGFSEEAIAEEANVLRLLVEREMPRALAAG